MKNKGAGHDGDHKKGGVHQGTDTSTIIFPRNISKVKKSWDKKNDPRKSTRTKAK